MQIGLPLQRSSVYAQSYLYRWSMVWESEPNKGPAFRELPAAVREVCESHCFCNGAPTFWQVGQKERSNEGQV